MKIKIFASGHRKAGTEFRVIFRQPGCL